MFKRNEIKFLNDWDSDSYEDRKKKIIEAWRKWRKDHVTVLHGSGKTEEEIFGLPYTSSCDYAGLWNSQAIAELKEDSQWRFEGLHYDVNENMYASFEHEDGSAETLDRRFEKIGEYNE